MIQQSLYTHFSAHVRFACAITIALILFFLSPFFTMNSLYAAVVINELYPKTEPPTQNWIELFNNGTEAVSLNRCRLQNSVGEVKTFIFNASVSIYPHGFLTVAGSQTNITFSNNGDTVQLFDEKNEELDSQSYLGILGYNTSMGRSSDGGGVWTLCTTPTYNTPNNCPQPSPTPMPLPTNTPTPTPKPLPTDTPTPAPTPAKQTFGSLLPSPTQPSILGAADTTSPMPIPDSTSLTLKIDKIFALKILLASIAWSIFTIVAVIFYVRRKKKQHLTA